MQKTYVSKDGATLSYYYFRKDANPKVVLLHGFCEDHSIWKDAVNELTECAILTIDLPGFGGSTVVSPVSIAKMAELIMEIIDFEQIEKCIMIGHSMGGYVALAFGEKFGERLAGMGLIHSHPYEDS